MPVALVSVFVSVICMQSEVWIEDKDEKSKLIDAYKGNLG